MTPSLYPPQLISAPLPGCWGSRFTRRIGAEGKAQLLGLLAGLGDAAFD